MDFIFLLIGIVMIICILCLSIYPLIKQLLYKRVKQCNSASEVIIRNPIPIINADENETVLQSKQKKKKKKK